MLRIVTFNTWKCDGDYAARLPLMTHGLAALDADVICLQECFAAWRGAAVDVADGGGCLADTALHLARALDLRLFHAPARWKPRDFEGASISSTSGLAVLTRCEAGAMEVLELPADSRDGQRIAQAVMLRSDGRRLRIVNTHLTHLRDATALRAAQLDAVLERWGQDDVPTLLAGDFNARYEDEALAALRAREDLDIGPELPAEWPDTYLLSERPRAIDQLLLLRGEGESPRLRARSRVLDAPDAEGRLPSDHAGLLVELAFDES